MKKIVMASAVMAATAMAGVIESRPEASVPTPVEHSEALDHAPKMSEKENVDWQRLREERRAAREQILKDLRNNTAAEKKNLREETAKADAPEVLPVAEKPLEKNVEKPKDELVRENKLEEKETPKAPQGKFPFGGPGKNIDNGKKPNEMFPPRPFDPRSGMTKPGAEKPNQKDWDKRSNPGK